MVALVVEALARDVCPETFNILEYSTPEEVKLVLEALASVLCPCTLKVPVTVPDEAERLLILAWDTVAVAKVLRPETVSAVAEALLNVAVEVAVMDPTVSEPPVAESKNKEER